jgi:tetratricopeptide (TPR) repeat protein
MRWWGVAAVALAVLLSMAVSLGGEFVWDDRPLILENPLVQEADRAGELLTRGFWESDDGHDRFRSFFRPIISLSYAIDYAIWGANPIGFHLTNLLLHFAVCLLVLRIALDERLSRVPAISAAVLFAVHPVHVESVAWISGRTDLIATALALFAFIQFRRERYRLAALIYFFALCSKEAIVMLPAIAGVWLLWNSGRSKLRIREALSAMLPFAFALFGYMIFRSAAMGAEAEPLYTLSLQGFVATAMFVIARYVTLVILPLGLDAHYSYGAIESIGDPKALIGVAMVSLLVIAALRLYRLDRRALSWLVWTLSALAPVLAFGRFGDVLLADRFLYFPSVGLAILFGFGLQAALVTVEKTLKQGSAVRSQRIQLAAMLIVASTLCFLSVRQSLVWRSDYTLFGSMLKSSPDSALVQNNYGLALYHRGELRAATDHFERAVELAPGYAMAHNNLAAALHRAGDSQRALAHYGRALDSAPGLMMAGANRGHLLVESGRTADGLKLLRRTAELHPRSTAALYALADGLLLADRAHEALPVVDTLQGVDADFVDTLYLRGKVLASQGRSQEAAEQMRLYLAAVGDRVDGARGRRLDLARSIIANSPT